MAQVESNEAPTQCFVADTLLNDRGDSAPILSDTDFFMLLTADHVLTKIKVCWNDLQIVGIQTTYGVWGSDVNASKLVEMEQHGTVNFDGPDILNKSSYTCDQYDVGLDETISYMRFYRTDTVFRRLVISNSLNEMYIFGLSVLD